MGPHDPDNFHEMAHSLTESIQDALTADAFPSHEKPMIKERKALLGTVLGKQNITAKELGEAYTNNTPNYSARGRGKPFHNYNSNWRGRGRGGGRRGRGRNNASDNLQPGH